MQHKSDKLITLFLYISRNLFFRSRYYSYSILRRSPLLYLFHYLISAHTQYFLPMISLDVIIFLPYLALFQLSVQNLLSPLSSPIYTHYIHH